MVTEQEARDMQAAIEAFQNKDSAAQKAQQEANLEIARTWFRSLGLPTPTTRQQALSNFKTIEGLLKTETDRFRLAILREELNKANEKYKDIKRNG